MKLTAKNDNEFSKKRKKNPFYNFQKFKLKLYLYKKIKHFEIINDDEGEL